MAKCTSCNAPLAERGATEFKCPDCGEPLYYKKNRKSVICKAKNCTYKRDEEMAVIE